MSAPNKKQQNRDSSEWQTPGKKNNPGWFRCSEHQMVPHTDTPRHSMQELTQPVRISELSKGTLTQKYDSEPHTDLSAVLHAGV